MSALIQFMYNGEINIEQVGTYQWMWMNGCVFKSLFHNKMCNRLKYSASLSVHRNLLFCLHFNQYTWNLEYS
jgi:hypothetical protein